MSQYIVQISDSHISNDFPQRIADLEKCVQHINALESQPALVIHTGDVAHDGLPEEYKIARQLLEKLESPCFVMAGNRDNRQALLDVFADSRLLHTTDEWIQYSIDHLPVRLLLLDTVSIDSNKGRICQKRFDHLTKLLASDPVKPTLLFLHHPPFEAVGIPDPYQYEDWSDVDKMSELISGYANIRGMYCGHVHRPLDGTIAGLAASAITCAAGDLRKGSVSDAERAQPVFKVIELPIT